MLGLLHLLAASTLKQSVLDLANPFLSTVQVLIPALVARSALMKVMDHQESGMGMVVELIFKGGGSFLAIEALKKLAGI